MQAGQDRQESAASEQVCGTPVQESSVNDSAMTSHDKGHEKNENGKSSAEQGGACEQDRDDEDENEGKGEGGEGESRAEDELARLALAFFTATTKSSTDNEDILPQEDSDMMKLSVFNIFASLFPEAVGEHGAGVKNKRLRLHFNKIGYQIYSKEQSRRVPAVRAKPGNPGYGFRRARWRDTTQLESDRQHCIQVLREVGCSEERISAVLDKVQGTCLVWDSIRRPSRPAGPGRPRRPEDASATSPVLNTASPKQVAWVAKCPKTGPSKKPQSASEKRVCDFKGLDSKGGKGGAPSAPGAAAPRASTCAKSKARGSTGGKARKEGAELRDETVPNLVKDEVRPLPSSESAPSLLPPPFPPFLSGPPPSPSPSPSPPARACWVVGLFGVALLQVSAQDVQCRKLLTRCHVRRLTCAPPHRHQRAKSCRTQRAACPNRPTSPSALWTRGRGSPAVAASPRTRTTKPRTTKHATDCRQLSIALRGQDAMPMVSDMVALRLLLLCPQEPSGASRARSRDTVPREPSASKSQPRPREPTSRCRLPTRPKSSAPFRCQACQAVHMSAPSDTRCAVLACLPVFGHVFCVAHASA